MSTRSTDCYPLHHGARTSYRFLAVLLLLTVIFSPFFFWPLILSFRGRIEYENDKIRIVGLRTRTLRFSEWTSLAIVHFPVQSRGLGGLLLNLQIAGSQALHLMIRGPESKTSSIYLSSYERHEELLKRIREQNSHLECPLFDADTYRTGRKGTDENNPHASA
ncbi:MAG: hypothetical protein QF752_16730 [Planctomycetota bacterium]|nr:hypothetical protein [Planctomycetota bacterium]